MNLFGLFQISGSALTAERLRAEVVTSNLANAETTRTAEGGPYQSAHGDVQRPTGIAVSSAAGRLDGEAQPSHPPAGCRSTR